jgi:hypothetical protein
LLRCYECNERSVLLVVSAEWLGDWETYEPRLTDAGQKLLDRVVREQKAELLRTFGTHLVASVHAPVSTGRDDKRVARKCTPGFGGPDVLELASFDGMAAPLSWRDRLGAGRRRRRGRPVII